MRKEASLRFLREIIKMENIENIRDKIGGWGLVRVVWSSTPWCLKFSVAYGLFAYNRLLRKSYNLEELLTEHREKYRYSLMFRLFRPRYHRAEKILRDDYWIR